MTVLDFDIHAGIYAFRMDRLDTVLHRHPAVEIIVAEEGTFTLTTANGHHPHQRMAVIDTHQRHQVVALEGLLHVTMIEHHRRLVQSYLESLGITLTHGYYTSAAPLPGTMLPAGVVDGVLSAPPLNEYDPRIREVIRHLNEPGHIHSGVMKDLTALTFLSESRLSHLFKENTGISIKQYLVWNRLKLTIAQHLETEEDLYTALLQGGFYDQPHFSRSFKSLLGIPPARVYNSRTIQG